ncbi:YkvA family protein [Virgibacillus xinjiangensis]|uniref:YkvA family protein n=1 Tax=Virgibacillus xinjiangensis TaxID=393090 RepID=A0ABV7CSB9_9BACI
MWRLWRRMKFLLKFRKSVPFIKDFILSGEVDKKKKIMFAGLAVGYVLLPFDLIPDFLLGLGLVDDIAVASFLLQQMVKSAPISLKDKYEL